MLMSIAEDEDSQKRGIVGLLYNFGLFDEKFDCQAITRSVKLRNALPIRFVAMHYCYNQPSFIDFFNYERFSFDRHTRLRCRAHQGKLIFPIHSEDFRKHHLTRTPLDITVSATKFHSELSSYGIISSCVPASLIGGLKSRSHQEWIQMRRSKEKRAMFKPKSRLLASNLDLKLPGTLVSGPSDLNCKTSLNTATPSASSGIQPLEAGAVAEITSPVTTVVQSSVASSQALPNVIENIETSSDSGDSGFVRRTVTPTSLDVLFGRGKVKEHPGNVKLHQLIEKRLSRYEVAEKWEKTVIAEEIVAIIKEPGGRFLRPRVNGDGWLEVDKEIAREKVSHTFRSRRPKIPKKRKMKGDMSMRGPKIFFNNNY